jgi:hypothetical protein
MNASGQGFGMAVPAPHHDGPEDQQPPVRYVVLIDSAATDSRLARLYLASRVAVAEFDASAPEVSMMTAGLAHENAAAAEEWDAALAGHTAAERAAAEVYTLDV